MKQEINIFDEQPSDLRTDRDRNAKLLNIVFIGATFGNFLKYFLERFSKKTPVMEEDPFTEIGTSHALKSKDFSGLIQKYHLGFINDNEGQTELPICLIVASTKKHYLYLKQAQWFRAGDTKISPDDLWKKAIGEMPEQIKSHAMDIIKLYDIKETAHFSWLPKFIVRDWYKCGFLMKQNDTYEYKFFEILKKHPFFKKQKTFELDLETFFYWKTFLKNIKEMNDLFSLDLDFDRSEEMKEVFDRGLEMDKIRQECNMTDQVFRNDSDIDFRGLNVATEAFIYAMAELENDFIQMPLPNRFFRDLAELNQFIEHYPSHYKAMNPNLPEFNGKPNPFYLKKGK
mgnify:CR=1 FL=1